jgi:NTE family protein
MRVGIVLGAGGVVGASWLIGALEALESETGWSAGDAEHIVGTSAGSVIGTLLAAGIPPAYISAYASGRSLDGLEPPPGLDLDVAELEARESGDAYRLVLALPPIGPGSWRMALSTLRHPMRHPASAVLCGWLPRGFVSTAPITRIVDRFVAGDWAEHPNLWIVACDYASGRRTVFGRDDAPPAQLRDAVAASCAIPAFYHPVRIAGRRYVDGGICSLSNADLLCGRDLDAVIVLNPMSAAAEAAGGGPVQRAAGVFRGVAGRRLGHELRKLRAEGTQVIALQPTADDLDVMGANMMARSRRVEVMEQSFRSTARVLRERRNELPKLSRGSRGRKSAARATPAPVRKAA